MANAKSTLNVSSSIKRYPVYQDNYVYLYHTDTLLFVPEYADSVTDSLQVQYSTTPIMSRTAPIYSYSYSGPRSMQVAFSFHRDMMMELNYDRSNVKLNIDEDYVDRFIREIQAAALPSYTSASKLVNPPLVAVRLGSDIFIKGVVQGSVSVTYKYPIIPGITSSGAKDTKKNRYSNVDVAFSISEVDPYDAETVMKAGSFRGLSTTLDTKVTDYWNGVETSTISTTPDSTEEINAIMSNVVIEGEGTLV